MLIIPDISFWQDDNSTPRKVDFAKMKSAGASGVIIRAGQNTWVDPDLRDYWRDAKAAGLLRGTYWFYDSRSDPRAQADLFYNQLADDLPELGAWMDFEERYGGSYGSETHMRRFSEKLLDHFPESVEVGVYTNYYYWIERIPSVNRAWWTQFPLWVANYDVQAPRVPPNWTSWLFWQYTSRGDGLKYGVESREIDLNYYDGTTTELYEYFGIENTEPKPYEPIRIELGGKVYSGTVREE